MSSTRRYDIATHLTCETVRALRWPWQRRSHPDDDVDSDSFSAGLDRLSASYRDANRPGAWRDVDVQSQPRGVAFISGRYTDDQPRQGRVRRRSRFNQTPEPGRRAAPSRYTGEGEHSVHEQPQTERRAPIRPDTRWRAAR